MKRLSIFFHAIVLLLITLAMSMTIEKDIRKSQPQSDKINPAFYGIYHSDSHQNEDQSFGKLKQQLGDAYIAKENRDSQGPYNQNKSPRLLMIMPVDQPLISEEVIKKENGAYLQRTLDSLFADKWAISKSVSQIQGDNLNSKYTISLSWNCEKNTTYRLIINRSLNDSQIRMKGSYQNSFNQSDWNLNKFKDPQKLPFFESVDIQVRRKQNILDSQIFKIKQAYFCFPLYSIRYKNQFDESEIKMKLTYDPLTNFVNILSKEQSPY